jgi:hypothetical protein
MRLLVVLLFVWNFSLCACGFAAADYGRHVACHGSPGARALHCLASIGSGRFRSYLSFYRRHTTFSFHLHRATTDLSFLSPFQSSRPQLQPPEDSKDKKWSSENPADGESRRQRGRRAENISPGLQNGFSFVRSGSLELVHKIQNLIGIFSEQR